MNVDGTIIDVMETWPLQLFVLSAETVIHVSLSLDTTVTKANEAIGMDQLRPDLHIRIRGRRVGESGLVAESITVLDEP